MAAQRDAVEKGIGMILLSQTEIENFMLKRDQIITKTSGMVKGYDIVSESKTSDGLFQIKIKARLSKTAMHADLAAAHILIATMDKPRVMVVVPENNAGASDAASSYSENAIVAFLKDPYDFELVDPQVVASLRASKEKMASLTGDPVAAAAIGSRYGAEVMVCGTAMSKVAEGMSQNLGGMVSVQADVNLRAINCSNARIIGTADGHAAKVHISPATAGSQAISKASVNASQKLLDAIMKDWSKQVNNGIGLTVSVKNVVNFRLRKTILQTIEAVSGVSSVNERGWDESSKVLDVDVQYKGNANGFCDKIDGLKMKAGGGSLSVSGVQGQSVTLIAQVM
jgi:hypothetical protein